VQFDLDSKIHVPVREWYLASRDGAGVGSLGTMLFDPAWTEKASFSFGRDPLGMQATSVRIYRSLVPGLTNVTNRLRYYSFYCWTVDTWEKREHADDTRRWRAFIRRAEILYAMASLIADPNTSGGMGGREWAEKNLDAVLQSSQLDLTVHDDPDAKGSISRRRRGTSVSSIPRACWMLGCSPRHSAFR
jgi:hypothetical protein